MNTLKAVFVRKQFITVVNNRRKKMLKVNTDRDFTGSHFFTFSSFHLLHYYDASSSPCDKAEKQKAKDNACIFVDC